MIVATLDNSNVLSLEHRRATRHLAQKLSKCLQGRDLVILDGQLGSGKTFLVRALCRALGLPERVRVTSPTFALLHEIGTTPRITHADLYRLSSPRDLLELGLVERREDGDLVLVEWGMPYVEALGGDALILEFSHDPRRVQFRATGSRSEQILAALNSEY